MPGAVMSLFVCGTVSLRSSFFDVSDVFSVQVDRLEVVNKQYVRVIPVHGVNTSEVVCTK